VAAVLAVGRVAALAGHQLVWSWWAPVAYLWQDAAVVLVYAGLERVLRRLPLTAWAVYAAFVAYVALGVPVVRVMSTHDVDDVAGNRRRAGRLGVDVRDADECVVDWCCRHGGRTSVRGVRLQADLHERYGDGG
jgi:hypothetical protein